MRRLNHTSHVTRHTSHFTRHTSSVTRHTSHVTRHTSHVTRQAKAVRTDIGTAKPLWANKRGCNRKCNHLPDKALSQLRLEVHEPLHLVLHLALEVAVHLHLAPAQQLAHPACTLSHTLMKHVPHRFWASSRSTVPVSFMLRSCCIQRQFLSSRSAACTCPIYCSRVTCDV